MENLSHTISTRLMKDSIFYFPKELYSMAKEDIPILELPQNAANKVIVMDSEGHSEFYSQEMPLQFILSKNVLLERTLFDISEQKEKLNKKSFDMLLMKYEEKLKLAVFCTEWMNSNLHTLIVYPSKKLKDTFWYQRNIFKTHYEDIITTFELGISSTVRREDLLKKLADRTWKKRLGLDKLKMPYQIPIIEPKNKVVPKKKLQKKKVIITDEEAEEYILKAVFNQN